MKKNILLLINGFGVEQAGSYDIYNAELMPNLDKLTKERLFTSLSSDDLDYKSGYRTFSIGINEALTYSIVDRELSSGAFKENKLFKYILAQLYQLKSKLHVFCYWDNEKTIEQLAQFLKIINGTLPQTKIIVHLIFCQRSLKAYKDMDTTLTLVNYDLGSNVCIGLVTGESNLSKLLVFRDYVKTWVTEAGEKWKDIGKKISVLVETKTLPIACRTFNLAEGDKVEDNDQVLFFNYSNVDVTAFKKELKIQKYRKINVDSIKFYSLFPVKSDENVPFMYNFAVSSSYALNSLKTIGAKCLILDKKEKCPYINYYFTGLRNNVDPDLKYIATDDGLLESQDKLVELLKSSPQELIIINYEIETCKNVQEIEDKLKFIDGLIGKLELLVNNDNYGLFISSLYGIEKEMYNQKNTLCKIDFSVRVPCIFVDGKCTKAACSFAEGNVYDLAKTIYTNINPEKGPGGLVKKKSSLLSIFYKKKR